MERARRSLFQPSSSSSTSSVDEILQSSPFHEFPPPLVEFPRSPSAEISSFHQSPADFMGENDATLNFNLHQQLDHHHHYHFSMPEEMESSESWFPSSTSMFPPLPHSNLLADENYLSFMENPPHYVNYLTDAHKIVPPTAFQAPNADFRCTSTMVYERPLKRLKKDEEVGYNSPSSPVEKKKVQRTLNTTLKERAKPGTSQSVAAKERRERISERLKILQNLVPNGTKVDLVTMLEKAINYVKFMQLQLEVLSTDQYWPNQASKEKVDNHGSTTLEADSTS